jgi:Ricin-type beta-trefoil lectin domain-like
MRPKPIGRIAIVATLAMLGTALVSTASAVPATAVGSTSYSVSVGSVGSYSYPTDTPASGYIDKDGTFYFQQSASLYGATDPRYWQFYSGTNFDTATLDTAISNAVNPSNSSDKNNDTTWRCNNSPTGLSATVVAGSGYQSNYCDLVGVWVDPDTGDWYGLVHNEFTMSPFGDALHYDAIDYAKSTNEGMTWTIEGHAITSPYSTTRNDTTAFPNQTYDYGDGDPRLFVDEASGYFYVYYGSRIVPKGGVSGGNGGLAHVARAPISGKMATGTWEKWYNGSWSQPGVGGSESNLVPVDSTNTTGYTPIGSDYSPSNTGDVPTQEAAGTLPSKSRLFLMNIAYDAYLGLYIGEPEVVSGTAPQQFYATSNLATQKWTLIGDTGSYTSGSWYRWMVDSGSDTLGTVIGKSFRSYCSISCNSSDGEYANITISGSSGGASTVDTSQLYTISSGAGRTLAQVSGASSTTSAASSTPSANNSWQFGSNGDGSYVIINSGSGNALSVPSTVGGRAWGTAPTVTAVASSGQTTNQQWWVIPEVDSSGVATGALRLVNRYSGLALALSAVSGELSETTPVRSWTDSSGSSVGNGRTASQQQLSLTSVGTAGIRSGSTYTFTVQHDQQLMNVNGGSTTAGATIIQWPAAGSANERWTAHATTGGAFTLVAQNSGLCLDVTGGSTARGTGLEQWTCNGAQGEQWKLGSTLSGAYQLVSNLSADCIDVPGSSTTQGTQLDQWTCVAGSLNEFWKPQIVG